MKGCNSANRMSLWSTGLQNYDYGDDHIGFIDINIEHEHFKVDDIFSISVLPTFVISTIILLKLKWGSNGNY